MAQTRFLLLLTVSVLAVFSHWEIWSNYELALGLNHTLFWFAFAAIVLLDQASPIKADWRWLMPLALIALSFAIYQAPWLKSISALLLPALLAVVLVSRRLPNPDLQFWNLAYVLLLVRRAWRPMFQLRHTKHPAVHPNA